MTRNLSLWFLIVSLLVIFSVFSTGQELAITNYQPADAVRIAQIRDRQIIFIFVHPECHYCTLLKDKTLSDPEVIEQIEKHFVLSTINVDKTFTLNLPTFGEVTNRELASKLGMRGTPHTVFLYPPAPELRGITVLRGYRKPDFMKKVLHFIGREIYDEDVEFSDYTVGKVGKEFYNYQVNIKNITKVEMDELLEIEGDLKVVEEIVELKSLQIYDEVILNFSDKESQKEFANELISTDTVKKVFSVVEETEGQQGNEGA